jgi:hypothetical protein
MRFPQMTTRRWMVAVAALAVAFGASVWASRLKRRHDEFVARATWHAEQETYYRDLVARSATPPFRGMMPEPAPEAPEKTLSMPHRTIERWLGLPESKSDPTPDEETDRVKAAHAFAAEMSARCDVLIARNAERQSAFNQSRLEYHTALRRKYVAAAAHPWLPIVPDPPKPN